MDNLKLKSELKNKMKLYVFNDILKENDLWQEEWDDKKKRPSRSDLIDLLFDKLSSEEIRDIIFNKYMEKSAYSKKRLALEEDFKALGMEDESILMEVNLKYLERAIKEFKLKTKEVKKTGYTYRNKDKSPLYKKLENLGFIELSINNMIKTCTEEDLNVYAKLLEVFRANNPLESNSNSYLNNNYPINPFVEINWVNEDYTDLNLRLVSEIFEAINNGFENILVNIKEDNPNLFVSLVKLYTRGFILVKSNEDLDGYDKFNDIFNSTRDFSIVKGRHNFPCITYHKEGIEVNCSEGKCVDNSVLSFDYSDCIENCRYKSQRDNAKIANIVATNYAYFAKIQKQDFFSKKKLLILDDPQTINEQFLDLDTSIYRGILAYGNYRVFIDGENLNLSDLGISKEKNYFIGE